MEVHLAHPASVSEESMVPRCSCTDASTFVLQCGNALRNVNVGQTE
jgi:hypothetical protein